MPFVKAVRTHRKLKLALMGPAGSGKTLGALLLATGMLEGTGKRIAFLDSENDRALIYANRFDFDHQSLQYKSVNEYLKYWEEAEKDPQYGALIIDSSSHAWKSVLNDVAQNSKSNFSGNTWAAWSSEGGTPAQRKLIEKVLNTDLHLICTMRSKTDWQTEKNDQGKNVPVRIGLKPEQGKDIEYEFDMLIEIDQDNTAKIIKDCVADLQNTTLEKLDIPFGRMIISKLTEGKDIKSNYKLDPVEEAKKYDSIDSLRAWFQLIPQNDRRKGSEVYEAFIKRQYELETEIEVEKQAALEKDGFKPIPLIEQIFADFHNSNETDYHQIDGILDQTDNMTTRRYYFDRYILLLARFKINYVPNVFMEF